MTNTTPPGASEFFDEALVRGVAREKLVVAAPEHRESFYTCFIEGARWSHARSREVIASLEAEVRCLREAVAEAWGAEENYRENEALKEADRIAKERK